MTKIALDAREMEHPIPLQLAMKYLKEMQEDQYLYMIHRKQPIPLIEIAKEKAFQHLSHLDTHETWHILITKNQHINLKELLDV